MYVSRWVHVTDIRNLGLAAGIDLALAMVEPALGALGTQLEVVILGERHKATVIADSPFDPNNVALRS